MIWPFLSKLQMKIVVLAIATVILGMALSLPKLLSMALFNATMVERLHLIPCDPSWFGCQKLKHNLPFMEWVGNVESINKINGLIHQEIQLFPDQPRIMARLAELQFARGDRQAAAKLLPTVPISLPVFSPAVNGFRRLTPLDYQSYLIAANQRAASGDWENAVLAFRLALSLGAAYFQPSDSMAYDESLAHWHAEQAAKLSYPAVESYLAAKYMTRIGHWDEARDWIERAKISYDHDQLSVDSQARISMYAGIIQEANGDYAGAVTDYREAHQLAPGLNEPQIRLLRVVRQMTNSNDLANAIAASLQQSGPTYHLGAQGDTYTQTVTATVKNGWILVGYDLDEENLTSGSALDVWLWWRVPVDSGWLPDDKQSWLQAGQYWLQKQTVINLATNAGFEWGTWTDEQPFGYLGDVYGVTPEAIRIEGAETPDGKTNVLQLNNTLSRRVGLLAEQQPVRGDGWYLMAGWMKDGGNSNLGRLCTYAEGGGPYYITQDYAQHPHYSWVHYAQLARPVPGRQAEACGVFVVNYDTNDRAEWDNILLVQIEEPH